MRRARLADVAYPADTSPDAARVQLEIYRRMRPSDRLRVALELTRLSRDLMASGIRARHPEYSDEELRWALLRSWLGAEMFACAYPGRPTLAP